MQSFSAALQIAGDAWDTSALDSFLRKEEEPAPSCAASEVSSLSDDQLPTASDAWVPTPYFAQRSGYNRLHVAMHAINEVCLMLWRMHAYFR